MGSIRIPRRLSWFFCLTFLSACSYRLQGTQNILKDEQKVERLYIAPMANITYKPGVEILVYNSLIKRIGAQGAFRIVSDRATADAVIEGRVTQADQTVETHEATSNLNPKGAGLPNIRVAVLYRAWMSCEFTLTRLRPTEQDPIAPRVIWSSTFQRNKFFPANTQLGVAGTTSNLINESELDRALAELSENMMSDVYESMFSLF